MSNHLPKIYIISGLGAGKEAFSALDLSQFRPIYLDWITPIENETLSSYALRLAEQIDEAEYYLMGLSFGGMLAVEIAKQNTPKKLFLISTAAVSQELPSILKVLRWINILAIVPDFLISKPTKFLYYLFGIQTSKEKKQLAGFLKNTTPGFLKWAIRAIAKWGNVDYPEVVIRFHGKGDKMILFPKARTCIPLKGGHLAVLQDPFSISKELQP